MGVFWRHQKYLLVDRCGEWKPKKAPKVGARLNWEEEPVSLPEMGKLGGRIWSESNDCCHLKFNVTCAGASYHLKMSSVRQAYCDHCGAERTEAQVVPAHLLRYREQSQA